MSKRGRLGRKNIITCLPAIFFFFFCLDIDGPAASDATEDCDETLSASSSWNPAAGPGRVGWPSAMLYRRNRSSCVVSYNKNNPVL
jgi:hypothetical protein